MFSCRLLRSSSALLRRHPGACLSWKVPYDTTQNSDSSWVVVGSMRNSEVLREQDKISEWNWCWECTVQNDSIRIYPVTLLGKEEHRVSGRMYRLNPIWLQARTQTAPNSRRPTSLGAVSKEIREGKIGEQKWQWPEHKGATEPERRRLVRNTYDEISKQVFIKRIIEKKRIGKYNGTILQDILQVSLQIPITWAGSNWKILETSKNWKFQKSCEAVRRPAVRGLFRYTRVRD